MSCRRRRIAYGVYRCMWCSSRPKSNRRNGRNAVDQFEVNEIVTFRIYQRDVDTSGHLKSSGMPVPDQSMNRLGIGGAPFFVLLPEPSQTHQKNRKRLCMGIVAVRVKNLPKRTIYNGKSYLFRLEHDPTDHNYHHCELRMYLNGSRVRRSGNLFRGASEKAVKKYYREILADRARLLLHSEV